MNPSAGPAADPRAFLRALFTAAVRAADPRDVLAAHLPPKPRGRCVVVGAGKASAAMAAAVDAAWPDVELGGAVVTRYGHALPAGRITVLEAGHPVPDARSEQAALHLLQRVQGLGPDDLVLALISGGGSATLALPIDGLTLEQKGTITRALLASGASISEINVVRRHLSRIKGGALARAAHPARVVTLLVSDVPGDDPAAIASGPTIESADTPADALAIVERLRIDVPELVRRRWSQAVTPAEAGPAPHVEHRLIASAAQSLRAAAEAARSAGVQVLVLGDRIEGESRELGRAMADMALSMRALPDPARAPALLLSGGETTVSLSDTSPGRGGRNTEFLLSLALALDGAPGIWALAADTDGIDGTEDAAGAIIGPDTLARAQAIGLDAHTLLHAHDSYSFFAATGELLVTGPTHTNVNDFRAVLVF
jgi:hydroxypyruvate reductase